MDLASQLRDLRARAGSPSYRTLERLIARQGIQRRMGRSTIQEKLSGKSSLNFPQVLAIVEALAEYARTKEAPLPQHETESETWRDRVVASSKDRGEYTDARSSETGSTVSGIEWNIEPLRAAQMYDLVDLIHDYRSKPVADWLPRVLLAMTQAEMTITDFLEKAAEDSPQGIVRTVQELEIKFPYTDESNGWGNGRSGLNMETVGQLLRYSARRHGDSASPAIVVGLRRAQMGHHVGEYLAGVARWFLAEKIEMATELLRTAALGNDANSLLQAVGERRIPTRIVEVVKHLDAHGKNEDALKIANGIGLRRPYEIRMAVEDFEKHSAPREALLEIARGVKYSDYAEYIEIFSGWGLSDFAELLSQASDEPPF
ncbi:hypothetical protein ACH4U5_27730 [Streptomyces sp. NPDC020858]|uniref:hypothetical protein n=1 Tax=Streptomyces sp. NPDC020858 TaxID=3365097 RepID=UPI0037BA76E3